MKESEPTVFVVDDDPSVCESLELLLRSVGRKAETFSSAAEFLEAYDPGRAGCLVLDLRMQGMNGLDLQGRLAALEATLPIIIISAHAGSSMAARAMERGALGFVQKPFRHQELLDEIERAIDEDARRRARRADGHRTAEASARAGRRQGDGS